jgi:hypothetical protein
MNDRSRPLRVWRIKHCFCFKGWDFSRCHVEICQSASLLGGPGAHMSILWQASHAHNLLKCVKTHPLHATFRGHRGRATPASCLWVEHQPMVIFPPSSSLRTSWQRSRGIPSVVDHCQPRNKNSAWWRSPVLGLWLGLVRSQREPRDAFHLAFVAMHVCGTVHKTGNNDSARDSANQSLHPNAGDQAYMYSHVGAVVPVRFDGVCHIFDCFPKASRSELRLTTSPILPRNLTSYHNHSVLIFFISSYG